MSNWIKLHRKITEWEWYTDANTMRLFLHLLLTANYEQKKWRGVEVLRGQRIIGRKQLSMEIKLSEQKIRTSLDKLKSTNEITTESNPNYSIITITNYEQYQSIDQPINQRITNDQPTNNQRITTTKEIKKLRNKEIDTEEKNIKKEKTEKPEGVTDQTWIDFIALRKIKRAPLTQTALANIQRESERAGWPLEDALREMCARGWQGFKADWVAGKSAAQASPPPMRYGAFI